MTKEEMDKYLKIKASVDLNKLIELGFDVKAIWHMLKTLRVRPIFRQLLGKKVIR